MARANTRRATKKIFVTGGSGFVGGALIRRLRARGLRVAALARSPDAAAAVGAAGADPVAGDLTDLAAMATGMAGCQLVVHAAAKTNEWGSPADFWAANVDGVECLLAACRRAGVARLVHVSSEAVIAHGGPLIDVDEGHPYPAEARGLYSASKQAGERLVRAADGGGLATVVVRPRLVWGVGDRALTPGLLAAMGAGRWIWWGDGSNLTSTCHVQNLCEGIMLAAERGVPGGVYFLSDGDVLPMREFVAGLVRTHGVEPSGWQLPRWLAPWVVRAGERAWRSLPLPGAPPLEATTLALTFTPVTVSDRRARDELGYRGEMRRAEGLAQMRAAASAANTPT